MALYLATIYHRGCHDNYHDLYPKDKIYNIMDTQGGGTALDRTLNLFIKFQFYCGRFVALQNWGIFYHKISVDLMLSSAYLLYRYRKFVVPVYHYPWFKANLV